MPIYEYECKTCNSTTETFASISDIPATVRCRSCRGIAHRVLSRVAVHCDTATWINDDLRGCLQGDGEKPVETKSELKAYCKAKDIVPIG